MGGILNPSSDNGQNRMPPLMRLRKNGRKKSKKRPKRPREKNQKPHAKKRYEVARKKVGGGYGRGEGRSGHREAATHP